MSDVTQDFAMGTIIGLAGWFFGGMDGFLKVLIAFAVIDYVSGTSLAFVNGTLSSSAGFKGILRKCVMLSFVGIAHLLDKYLLGGTAVVRTAVILFYVGNEGISIIENADSLGIPIPQMLKDRFLRLKNTHNNEPQKRKGKRKRSNVLPVASEDTNDEQD